jgi:hypothetical protein
MNSYNGAGVGSVIAFLKVDSGSGVKLKDSITSTTTKADGTSMTQSEVGKVALSELLQNKEALAASLDISEISTDRVSAGLEIVTPRVVTSEILTDTITPSTGNDVTLLLNGDNKFVLKGSASSSPVVSFDAQGNALFTGTLKAGAIEAGTITGMDAVLSHITLLSQGQDALTLVASSSEALQSTVALLGIDVTDLKVRTNAVESALNSISSSTLTLIASTTAQDLRIKSLEDLIASHSFTGLTNIETESLTVTGSSTFAAATEFSGLSFFSGTTTFSSNVTFSSAVEFALSPFFNKDTAGFAVIKAGAKKVDVVFAQNYIVKPVVNASIAFAEEDNITDIDTDSLFTSGIQSIVTKATTTGFTIILNKPAPRDIRFSWFALAVKDPQIFESIGLTLDQTPSTPPTDTGSSTPPTDTGSSTPPSTPPTDTGSSTPPTDTGSSTPPADAPTDTGSSTPSTP